MHDALHQQRFTEALNRVSERLDDLLMSARRYEPQRIPLEILDEIAVTIGELTLVLSDHLAVHHIQRLTHKVISRAESLRHQMRADELSREHLTAAIGALIEEIHLIELEDKRAA